MIFKTDDEFNLKGFQNSFQLLGLYKGRLDALFGKGCVDAVRELVKNYKPDYDPVLAVPTYDAEEVYKWVQLMLQRAGLYQGKLDGLWGTGSATALKTAMEHYRINHALPGYSYAWTGHERITDDVVAKVEEWMVKWGKPLEHVSFLFSCFGLETGGTFDPAARNNKTGARGLIQFMPKGSMIDLGVTDDQLKVMSVYEQLDWVFAYFEKYGYIKKCVRLEDYYLTIFYPARVGTDPDAKLGVKGTKLYEQNKVFDPTNRGFYTVGDICELIRTWYWRGMTADNRKQL